MQKQKKMAYLGELRDKKSFFIFIDVIMLSFWCLCEYLSPIVLEETIDSKGDVPPFHICVRSF